MSEHLPSPSEPQRLSDETLRKLLAAYGGYCIALGGIAAVNGNTRNAEIVVNDARNNIRTAFAALLDELDRAGEALKQLQQKNHLDTPENGQLKSSSTRDAT